MSEYESLIRGIEPPKSDLDDLKIFSSAELPHCTVPDHLSAVSYNQITDGNPIVSTVLRELLDKERQTGIYSSIEQEIPNFGQILGRARELVKPTMNAEFHDWQHAIDVSNRYTNYLEAAGFSQTVQQLGQLAGVFHDAGHPGFRYRQDAVGVTHPELSNEEYSATLAVEFLAPMLNPAQLEWIYDTILATSFGQRRGNDPATNQLLEQRPDLERPYLPVSLEQKLMHFADINATDSASGFEETIAGGFQLAREMGRNLPTTVEQFQDYLKGEAGFMRYRTFLMGQLSEYFNTETRGRLSMRLADSQTRIEALVSNFEGSDAEMAIRYAYEKETQL